MTAGWPALSRRAGDGRPVAPVGHVHLGLGSFFRAHQAWYTERSPDRDEWGIAAFTGRSAALAEALTSQDALYTLVTRSASYDRFDVVASLSATHPAGDHARFLDYLAAPRVRLVTLTVTEVGYQQAAGGGLDTSQASVMSDLTALRGDLTAPVRSAPGRLVAGLAARRAADAGAITVVPCDNLPDNGRVAARVVTELAELVDPTLAGWVAESVSVVSTVVDRITPRLEPADVRVVAEQTGRDDRAPVVTEPFSEWILSGAFPGGRPAWHEAGAVFTDDIAAFERRKLWLLNGAHSLLAYVGPLRGHTTVADAIRDGECLDWVEAWWREATAHLGLPAADVARYREALLERFANHRIRHLLAQIAADGSQKLPVRVLPVVRAERGLGRLPVGGLRILAGWLCHLRGAGAAVDDPYAADLTHLVRGPLDRAATRLLEFLDPGLGEDPGVRAAVCDLARQLCPS